MQNKIENIKNFLIFIRQFLFDSNQFDNGFGFQETSGHCVWSSILIEKLINEYFSELKVESHYGKINNEWHAYTIIEFKKTKYVLDITGDQFGFDEILVLVAGDSNYQTKGKLTDINPLLIEQEIKKANELFNIINDNIVKKNCDLSF